MTLPHPVLLQEVIRDYAQRSQFRGIPAEWMCHREGLLPGCGDRLTLYLNVEEGGTRLTFEASGCLLSQASAAMMVECLQMLSLEKAQRYVSETLLALQQGESLPPPLYYLHPLLRLPSRMRCATFPWNIALKLFASISYDARTADDCPRSSGPSSR